MALVDVDDIAGTTGDTRGGEELVPFGVEGCGVDGDESGVGENAGGAHAAHRRPCSTFFWFVSELQLNQMQNRKHSHLQLA
jgi:hypothetical protein